MVLLLLLHVFLPRICHAQDFHGRQYFFLNYIQDVDCLNMMFIMGEKRELRTCQVRYTTTFSYILSRISLYYLKLTTNSSNIFLLSLEWVCVFIMTSENSILGHLKYFFVYFLHVDENGDDRRNVEFSKLFQATRNGTFWSHDENTNSIWTKTEDIWGICSL